MPRYLLIFCHISISLKVSGNWLTISDSRLTIVTNDTKYSLGRVPLHPSHKMYSSGQTSVSAIVPYCPVAHLEQSDTDVAPVFQTVLPTSQVPAHAAEVEPIEKRPGSHIAQGVVGASSESERPAGHSLHRGRKFGVLDEIWCAMRPTTSSTASSLSVLL